MSQDQRGSAADDRRARIADRDAVVNRPDRPETSPVSDEALLSGVRRRHGLLAETMRATDPAIQAATLPPAPPGRTGSDGARPTQHRSDRGSRGTARDK
jgi:hypothetical protein